MESGKKSNEDSNSDLSERAIKCIQLLSLSSDIVVHDVNDGSMIRRCMCMKNTGCLLTGLRIFMLTFSHGFCRCSRCL
ncbi:hypothetical protein M514_18338 [Trichuris suis]|uniref:Uncharacterized protein n=1 Tax=Trichuris suis TaxID=68888 RepID=A0A085NJ20_9BILA|nr:hypothetical protein M514_18338 [Trichuris suis]